MLFRRTLSDPAEPAIIGRQPVVRKLWKRRLRNGAHVAATLWWDNSLSEAVVELTVNASFAEDTLAEGIAAGVLQALDADGAKEFVEEKV
jgi:hypothetical protein